MSSKHQLPIFEVWIDRLSFVSRQLKEMPSKIYNRIEKGLAILEGYLSQHSTPIPIEIHVEPAVVERVEVKRRW
jgi:hypothetical protein